MSEDDKSSTQEVQDRIRELAHSMWEWAGRQQDTALEYWVAAEKEVLATMRAAAERLTPGGKPEKATEPETEAAAAAAAATHEPVESGEKPAGGTETVEHPKPKVAKPKKK